LGGLERLQQARNRAVMAEKFIVAEAKNVINEELTRLFIEHPEIQTIAWGQKAREYNDEGMYPGVFGPEVREEERDGDDLDDRYYDMLYSGRSTTDSRVADLKAILEIVGEETLSDIFGEEHVVEVSRCGDSFDIQTEYAGC
jgi:hypothetical protein